MDVTNNIFDEIQLYILNLSLDDTINLLVDCIETVNTINSQTPEFSKYINMLFKNFSDENIETIISTLEFIDNKKLNKLIEGKQLPLLLKGGACKGGAGEGEIDPANTEAGLLEEPFSGIELFKNGVAGTDPMYSIFSLIDTMYKDLSKRGVEEWEIERRISEKMRYLGFRDAFEVVRKHMEELREIKKQELQLKILDLQHKIMEEENKGKAIDVLRIDAVTAQNKQNFKQNLTYGGFTISGVAPFAPMFLFYSLLSDISKTTFNTLGTISSYGVGGAELGIRNIMPYFFKTVRVSANSMRGIIPSSIFTALSSVSQEVRNKGWDVVLDKSYLGSAVEATAISTIEGADTAIFIGCMLLYFIMTAITLLFFVCVICMLTGNFAALIQIPFFAKFGIVPDKEKGGGIRRFTRNKRNLKKIFKHKKTHRKRYK